MFDSILCWETMEHFNFNPVAFVRELHRVLKPGGRIYITVPNRASFQGLFGAIFGGDDTQLIDRYFTFENHRVNGKLAFYGFHWREYTRTELDHLFRRLGFEVVCNTFVAFQDVGRISKRRKAARLANRVLGGVFKRYGTNVYLIAQKGQKQVQDA
jgi:SAM-dependent methyltransferase